MHICSSPTVALVLALSILVLPQLSRSAAIAKAETIFQHFRDGTAEQVVKELDSKLAQALPPEELKTVWSSLASQFGAFKTINERREGQHNGRQAVELFLVFEKETIVMRVVLDGEGRVAGLVFRPVSASVLPAGK